MNDRIVIASIALATSLAAGSAFAQDAGVGASPSPAPRDSNVLILAPLTPEGGLYGPSSPAPSSAPPASSEAPAAASSAPPASTAPQLPPPPPSPAVPPYATGALTQGYPPPPVGAPLSRRAILLRERLRLLDTSLPPIAEASRRSRITDGIIQMATGTVVGALGFAFPPASGANDLRPWLWTLGGVSIATGILDLAWVPARETLTAQYMRQPYATARERRARAHFGERALDDMAADGQRRRILTAVAGAVLPIGMLGVIYRDPIFNGTPYAFGTFDYVIIGFAAVEVVTSLIGLFTRSQEERLHDMYWQQIHMREAELNAENPALTAP